MNEDSEGGSDGGQRGFKEIQQLAQFGKVERRASAAAERRRGEAGRLVTRLFNIIKNTQQKRK